MSREDIRQDDEEGVISQDDQEVISRIEKLAEAGGSRVPFVKEISSVIPKQGHDDREHGAGL